MNKKINILFKIHFNYLLSKSFIIVVVFVLIAILLLDIIEATNYKDTAVESYKYYLDSQISYLQIIFSMFVPFVFCNSFLKKNDNYSYLLLPHKTNRLVYMFTKLYLITLVVIFIYLLSIAIAIVVGIIYFKVFIITYGYVTLLISQIITTFYYSFICVIITLRFNVIYTVFLGFVLNVVSTNLIGNINLVILNTNFVCNNLIYAMLLLVLVILINFIYYCNKDL